MELAGQYNIHALRKNVNGIPVEPFAAPGAQTANYDTGDDEVA